MFRASCSLAILSFVFSILGCSSSSTTGGTGATCNAAAPCGGSLDGTWSFTSLCVEGDLVAAMNQRMGLPAACDNTIQSATMSASGTVTFASGTETDNFTETTDVTLSFTAACESAVAGQPVTLTASTCATAQQSLLSASGGFTTANCSLSNGACACTASMESPAPTAPQSYTVSGNVISYAAGDPISYCVSGTTLTGHQALSGANGITVVSVFRKN